MHSPLHGDSRKTNTGSCDEGVELYQEELALFTRMGAGTLLSIKLRLPAGREVIELVVVR
jgi:hypothetical protein